MGTPGACFIVLMRYIHQNPIKAGLAKTAREYCYSSWGNDYLGLADLRVCMTESVIRRYTLAELTAWVDMPMPERYGCIDIDERRVIPDVEIRDAVINACGLRSISDFQLLTLERRKSVIQEVMRSLDVRKDTEVPVPYVSGRMLNNRLLLNGQFGYRDNATRATKSFIGDFDIQYLLLPNGNLSVKMYNMTNDRYFTKSSLNTQGLGIIMKKDFNGLRDLFSSEKKKKKNLSPEPGPSDR